MINIQKNDKRFVYLYFNRNEPEKIRQAIPVHVRYLKMANLKEYMGARSLLGSVDGSLWLPQALKRR